MCINLKQATGEKSIRHRTHKLPSENWVQGTDVQSDKIEKNNIVFRSRSSGEQDEKMNFSKVIQLTNRPINFAQSMYRVRFCITNQGEISSVGQSGRWSREHGENGICDETRSIRKLLLLRPSKKLSAKRILPLFEAVKVGIDAVLVIFCIFRFDLFTSIKLPRS